MGIKLVDIGDKLQQASELPVATTCPPGGSIAVISQPSCPRQSWMPSHIPWNTQLHDTEVINPVETHTIRS